MKKIAFFTILIFISIRSQAQIEQIFSARDDAQIYLNHYLSPVMNGLMSNLNNSWYSSGKTHKKWGFDITISASASIIPENEKAFQFIASEYNHLSLSSGSETLPTAAGGVSTTTLEATNSEGSITFNAPDGVGDQWPDKFFIPVSVPSPMIQIGVGIPSKTDIKLRYFPKVTNNEISFGMIGIGIQHDLTQHFKVLDKIPTLHISGLGAFTHTSLIYNIIDSGVQGDNQSLEMSINTYTIQVIGDIDLKLINFYLGIGYTNGTSNIDALGTYKYDFNNNGTFSNDEIITNPLQLNFMVSGMKTTAGVRFNLGPVKIFADYSLQKYPAVSTGLALSFR